MGRSAPAPAAQAMATMWPLPWSATGAPWAPDSRRALVAAADRDAALLEVKPLPPCQVARPSLPSTLKRLSPPPRVLT